MYAHLVQLTQIMVQSLKLFPYNAQSGYTAQKYSCYGVKIGTKLTI